MLNFEKLEAVEQTWVRSTSAVRQPEEWEGLRVKTYMSNKGKSKAEEEGETFTPFKEIEFQFSPKYFESLGLIENGMKHFRDPDDNNRVVLLVVDSDQAKFLKNRKDSNTGKLVEKGRKFTNSILFDDIVSEGLVPGEEFGYFYLNLVKEDLQGAPDWVKGAYKLVFDRSDVIEKGEEEDTDSVDSAPEVSESSEAIDQPVTASSESPEPIVSEELEGPEGNDGGIAYTTEDVQEEAPTEDEDVEGEDDEFVL